MRKKQKAATPDNRPTTTHRCSHVVPADKSTKYLDPEPPVVYMPIPSYLESFDESVRRLIIRAYLAGQKSPLMPFDETVFLDQWHAQLQDMITTSPRVKAKRSRKHASRKARSTLN